MGLKFSMAGHEGVTTSAVDSLSHRLVRPEAPTIITLEFQNGDSLNCATFILFRPTALNTALTNRTNNNTTCTVCFTFRSEGYHCQGSDVREFGICHRSFSSELWT